MAITAIRSRSGCATCKKQKVKCDEKKPSCSRCSKRGSPCFYPFNVLFAKPKDKISKINRNEERSNIFSQIKVQNFTTSDKNVMNRNRTNLFLKYGDEDEDEDDDEDECETKNDEDKKNYHHDINIGRHEYIISQVKSNAVPSYMAPSKINDSNSQKLLPLPPSSKIMATPYFKDAFEFYINFTAHCFVIVKPENYKDNPFNTIVPKYALKNDYLMDIILAFSLSYRRSVLNDSNATSKLIEELVSRCIRNLFLATKDSNSSPEAITMASLMLCAQRLYTRTNLETYFEIMTISNENFNKILKNYDTVHESDEIVFFLLRWMAFHDIMGVMSSISPRNFKMPSKMIIFKNLKIESTSKIDKMLGYDINLLPMFDELLLLIKEVEDCNSNEPFKVSFIHRSIQWKISFTKAYENSKHTVGDVDPILVSTNDAFYLAGLIHYYTRVLKFDKSHNIIQNLSNSIKIIFETSIESASSAETCSIFTLFIAACNSNNLKNREFFYSRFKIQFLGGYLPAGEVLKILDKTWNNNSNWISAVKELGTGFFLT